MTLRDKKSEALFQFAQYDAAAAEKSGYSNYSYWRSTLSVFLHNRAAVALLIVLALLLLFTFVQPIFRASTTRTSSTTTRKRAASSPTCRPASPR